MWRSAIEGLKGFKRAVIVLTVLFSPLAQATVVTFTGTATVLTSNGTPVPASLVSSNFNGWLDYDPYAQVRTNIFSGLYINFGSWGLERTGATINSVGVQHVSTDSVLYTDTISLGLYGTAYDAGYFLNETTISMLDSSSTIGDGSFIDFNTFASRKIFLALNSTTNNATVNIDAQIDAIGVPEPSSLTLFSLGLLSLFLAALLRRFFKV